MIFSGVIYAQDEDAEELFEDGDYFFAREEYSEAAYLYRQALRKEPENSNLHYKVGMAYLNIEGEEDKAINYFLTASKNTVFKYRNNYYPEKRAPHHTLFYLGNAYRITNQLDKALEAYDTFKSAKNFEKKYNVRVVVEEMKAVGRAKIIQDAPVDIYKKCFSETINSAGLEYHAIISANEKVLVWMNSQKFYEAIMMSVKQDGKWSKAVNITPQVGSDGEMQPSGLSADGTELLLVVKGNYDSDIYYSKFDGTFWSKAEPIKGLINSNFTEDHASFSADGEKILVSSDRRGSVGGLDIFISELQEDKTWGEPVNLGTTINTKSDETSAYFSPDESKIIFASKGHFNMGGYDLFASDIAEDFKYSFSYNLGYPINTTNDNTLFIPLKNGNSGIYTFRDDEGIGNKDIWFLEIIPYEETIAKALTRLSEENFYITITDPVSKEKIYLEYDAIEDKINVSSSNGKDYSIYYSREKNE